MKDIKKQLTDDQKNELYGYAWVVLTVNPFISEKKFHKKMIHFAKSKKMPIKAVEDYIKDGEN